MNILITCGPSYEPIDQVRRLTNFSTGRLGTFLANHFHHGGYKVFCFKGEGATWSEPIQTPWLFPFSTNQDLANQLAEVSSKYCFDVVLHAAALCDYRVASIEDGRGTPLVAHKLPTRHGNLSLTLEPAPKILPCLRKWFFRAKIVGWKYELDGFPGEVREKAWRQVKECQTDACVLNGAAYGAGYGLCLPPDTITHCPDLMTLFKELHHWITSSSEKPS